MTDTPASVIMRTAVTTALVTATAIVGLAAPSSAAGTFDDDDNNPHEPAIEAIATAGVTTGCSIDPPRYCPGQTVTRAEMASFLTRAFDLAPSTTDWFSDDDDSPHEADINAIAEAGITLGYADGTYRPVDSVRRDEMATFLVRSTGIEPTANDWFGDDLGTHETSINTLADSGITLGYGDGTYRPSEAVRRDEMASFLARALNLIPRPAAGSLNWTIAAGADPFQLSQIVAGFGLADRILDARVGGSIADTELGDVTVNIATAGDQPTGCCTVNRIGGVITISFDLGHSDWANTNAYLWPKIAAHEYIHAWQASLDCIATDTFVYAWLSEGAAEWLGWQALVDGGLATDAEADDAALTGAHLFDAIDRPLSDFEGTSGPVDIWPGYVGYLAVERLVADAGPESLRVVCTATAATGNRPTGFETAFGTTVEAFYADFDAWAATLP